jgi:hypothetical protein
MTLGSGPVDVVSHHVVFGARLSHEVRSAAAVDAARTVILGGPPIGELLPTNVLPAENDQSGDQNPGGADDDQQAHCQSRRLVGHSLRHGD